MVLLVEVLVWHHESHIFDQLLRINADRKITFWYGQEVLKKCFMSMSLMIWLINTCFEWHVALYYNQDDWEGDTGFIHNVLYKNYLAPMRLQDCEYYMCGPPMMNKAVIDMLLDLGEA